MLKSGLTTKFGAFCDLHSKETTIRIIDKKANVKVHKEIPSTPSALYNIIKPFQKDISVFVESTFNYYWMADLCEKKKIPFKLGHALYIKRARQGKHKDDDRDTILMSEMALINSFPLAYPYPAEMRPARDLFRKRMSFVAMRAGYYRRIQNMIYQQGYTESVTDLLRRKDDRYDVLDKFPNKTIRLIVEKDLIVIDTFDPIIHDLESQASALALQHDPRSFKLLNAAPGIGTISALTILYEVHTISRFPSPQAFSSYCRTVKARCHSAGKRVGHGDDKIGNPTLNWVFHEIACHMPTFSPTIKLWYDKLKSRKGEKLAKTIFVHKLSVAVYYMLKRKEFFDEKKFVSQLVKHTTIRNV